MPVEYLEINKATKLHLQCNYLPYGYNALGKGGQSEKKITN